MELRCYLAEGPDDLFATFPEDQEIRMTVNKNLLLVGQRLHLTSARPPASSSFSSTTIPPD